MGFSIVFQIFVLFGLLTISPLISNSTCGSLVPFSKIGLCTLITLDSVYSLCDIILFSLFRLLSFIPFLSPSRWKDESSDIVCRSQLCWTNSSSIDRYLFYILIWSAFLIFDVLTWGYLHFIGAATTVILSIPFVSEYLQTLSPFVRYRNYIFSLFRRTYRALICQIFASTLNKMCEITLFRNPQISHREISALISDFSTDHLVYFLKILILTNIFSQVEEHRPSLTSLLRKIYNRGMILDISPSHKYKDLFRHITDPRKKILTIIMTRRFDQFCNPYILLLLSKLYEESKSSFLSTSLTNFLISVSELTACCCAIYTACTLFSAPWLVGPLSLLFLNFNQTSDTLILDLLLKIGAFLLSLRGSVPYFVPPLLSSYGILLYNPVSQWIYSEITRKLSSFSPFLKRNLSCLETLLLMASFILLIRFLIPSPLPLAFLLGLTACLHHVTSWPHDTNHMTPALFYDVLVICGVFSSYSWLHLLSIIFVLFWSVVLFDFFTNPSILLDLEILTSYYSPSETHETSSSLEKAFESISMIDDYSAPPEKESFPQKNKEKKKNKDLNVNPQVCVDYDNYSTIGINTQP